VSEGFSADWLGLREPYDRAAVDRGLLGRLLEWAGRRECLDIVDLGAGTGSTLRRLAPLLGVPQRWKLVELDQALIEAGSRNLPAKASYRRLDLARGLGEDAGLPAGLITASALIDLVSAAWMDELAALVRRSDCGLYVVLTYDGRIDWQPAHPLDPAVRELVNRHQRTDKGFGPALGPDAAPFLARLLPGAALAPSDWRLGPGDSLLQQELLEGYAAAAAVMAPEQEGAILAWCQERAACIRGGLSQLTIGHLDLLRLPAGA
jgi:SAM-dependent methyltransferase